MQTERYKNLRKNLIELLEEHPNPTSPVEMSYVANQLDGYAREMDSIYTEELTDVVMEFATIVRDSELL